jgi:hypothetical protein
MPKRASISPEDRRARVYRERNRVVRAMGFASYAQYLQSSLWADIRSRVLSRSPECFACGARATQAHHTAYRKKDLEGRDLGRILAVCAGCHRKAEFRATDSEKLNTAQASAKLRQARTLSGRGVPKRTDPLTRDEVLNAVEVPLDLTKLRCEQGEYLGSPELDVGDVVRLESGAVARIEDVRQHNYLPRFRVGGRWVGKTRLKAKLIVKLASYPKTQLNAQPDDSEVDLPDATST